MKRNNDHQPISEVLQAFIAKHKKLEKGLHQISIREAWEQQMGPAIKKYTTDIQLKNNVLYIQLSSSVLREELSYGKEKIIANLNESLREELIEKLVLR